MASLFKRNENGKVGSNPLKYLVHFWSTNSSKLVFVDRFRCDSSTGKLGGDVLFNFAIILEKQNLWLNLKFVENRNYFECNFNLVKKELKKKIIQKYWMIKELRLKSLCRSSPVERLLSHDWRSSITIFRISWYAFWFYNI